MKVVAYVANLDEYKSIRNYWIDLYVNGNNLTYLDSFGDEHIPREIKKFIGNKNIIRNIYRMQASESVHRYFCIGFIQRQKVARFYKFAFTTRVQKKSQSNFEFFLK